VDLVSTEMSNKTALKQLFLIVCLMMTITSCNKQSKNTTNQGLTVVTADESLKSVLDQIYQTYEATDDKNEKLDLKYLPEQQAIHEMIGGASKVVFTTRELNPVELKNFKDQGFPYKPQWIATDGVALIINRGNRDSLMTMNELTQIFKGQITDWSQLKGSSQTGKITLVFDNANSSNLNYIMSRFGLKDVKGLNIFAAGSNPKAIEYVSQNQRALGFIGVSWISDGDSPLAAKLSKGLRVVGVSEKTTPTTADYFQPFQRDLGLQNYPLHRKVYAISRDGYRGFGSGLVNYIMRDVGNLIIEKCGLWPSKPFNREVLLNKDI